MQIIELGVEVHSEKVKAKYLQVVAELTGINQVDVNEKYGTLTIVGDVDPVLVIKKIRKAKMRGKIIRVGPVINTPMPYWHANDNAMQQFTYSNNNYPSLYHPPIVTAVEYYDRPYDNGGCNIL